MDEIVEGLLGLDLEVVDLQQVLAMSDVLGATWLEAGRICIDESLEDMEAPATLHPAVGLIALQSKPRSAVGRSAVGRIVLRAVPMWFQNGWH